MSILVLYVFRSSSNFQKIWFLEAGNLKYIQLLWSWSLVQHCCFLLFPFYFLVAIRKNTETRKVICLFAGAARMGGSWCPTYSTASLGVRGTLRTRVGGGSSEEKKQAEYDLGPGRRRHVVPRGVGPGQRSGPRLTEAWGPHGGPWHFFAGTSKLL